MKKKNQIRGRNRILNYGVSRNNFIAVSRNNFIRITVQFPIRIAHFPPQTFWGHQLPYLLVDHIRWLTESYSVPRNLLCTVPNMKKHLLFAINISKYIYWEMGASFQNIALSGVYCAFVNHHSTSMKVYRSCKILHIHVDTNTVTHTYLISFQMRYTHT